MFYRMFIFFFCFVISISARSNTVCVGSYVGNNVGFTSLLGGDQFNKVNVRTNGHWNGGYQLSHYKSTQTVEGLTVYSVAVPKEIELSDNAGMLTITPSNNNVMTVPTNDKWQAIFIQQTREGCARDTGGVWQDTSAGISSGSVSLNLSGKGLPSGTYQLNIPYVLAWGTSKDGDANRDFQNTWKAGNVGVNNVTGYFSINFVIKNKCEISYKNDILLDHGTLTPDDINGNQASSDELSVSCQIKTPVRFQFNPQQVELGNGVISQLSLNFSGKNNLDMSIPEMIKNDKFKVTSTLQKKSNVMAGKLKGVSVLNITYD
ncbi:TPA: hypothetical protein RPB66_004004 [Escherichia coli]|nr:hypothetical protein [Escherichia coli]HDY2306525.1 hypothetical protein [Escherichia coli]